MKIAYKREIVIGLCVVISIAILVFGIDYLKGVNIFKASNYYYVTYHNVNGLSNSAPVTINGFKVGLVRDIKYEYDHPGNVVVELSLDKHLHLPQGTKANLVTDMLGTSTIELELAHGDALHAVGDSLTGVNKKGLMESITDGIMPGVQGMMQQIDSIMASVNSIVSDPALKKSVNSLDGVMANLKATSENLAKVMASMPALSNEISATVKNARQMSESANTVVGDLAEVSAQIKQAHIDSTLANINSLTASLAEISHTLTTKESSLGMLINDPEFYNSLNGSVASLDSLLQDVKRNPKRYISIKLL